MTELKLNYTLHGTMELGRESSKERLVKLVEAVDRYSLEMAEGSQEASMSLLGTMASLRPDVPPRIGIAEIELARAIATGALNRQEALTIVTAGGFIRKFNRNFGLGTNAGEVIGWQDSEFRLFFNHLGCTLQTILHPEGQYGQDRMGMEGHLAMTTQHYYELLNLAENRLMQPASQAAQK